MEKIREALGRNGWSLFVYYFCFYMAVAPYVSFVSAYYKEIGLNASQIGIISGIGPVITIIGQFVWGRFADKAKYKNTVLLIATLSTALVLYAYMLEDTYPYLIIMSVIYSFVNCSIIQLSDTIALDFCLNNSLSFPRARLGGSIGYGVATIIVGFVMVGNLKGVFTMDILFLLISALSLLLIPKVRGSLREKGQTKYGLLFKDKRLVVLLIFNFILYLGYFFNMSFMAVHITENGGSSFHVGIAQAVSAFFEIPFLLNSQRIIRKLGVKATLIASAFTFALRWLLFGVNKNVWALVFICGFHGVGHIVISYCTSSYINKTVDQSLRASGQTLLGMVNYGFSKCIASIFGGIIANIIGIGNVFCLCALLSFVSIAVLWIFLPKISKEII